MAKRDYTPYQQKVIRKYYENQETIGLQQLAELTTEAYLADGAKANRVWKRIESALEKLKLPRSRIEFLLTKKDARMLAELVKELGAQ